MNRIEKLREHPCAVFDWMEICPIPDGPRLDAIAEWTCAGGLDIHHETGGGMALKSDDERTFPLCHRHHMDFHAARGIFRDWDKQKRREWQEEMVERYTLILCDPEAF